MYCIMHFDGQLIPSKCVNPKSVQDDITLKIKPGPKTSNMHIRHY